LFRPGRTGLFVAPLTSSLVVAPAKHSRSPGNSLPPSPRAGWSDWLTGLKFVYLYRFFLFRALQFLKFRNTPLRFAYLKNCHYNSISSSFMPFSTPPVYIVPLSGTYV
jgi:hypothetical protein